jgi:tetratricopeptide (TPR) repeat protein
LRSEAALPRGEAQAFLQLSQLYRVSRRPQKAANAIQQGLGALQRVDEPHDLPRYVAEEAEIHAALGDLDKADKLYGRAADLIEGLLVNAPSSRVKSSMIGAMSEISNPAAAHCGSGSNDKARILTMDNCSGTSLPFCREVSTALLSNGIARSAMPFTAIPLASHTVK